MFSRIEGINAGKWSVLATIIAVVFVRIILEYGFEAQKRIEEPLSLFLFITYFFSVIAGITLLAWLFSGKPLLKVARVVAFFSPLLWMPPFIDLVLSQGKGFVLSYFFNTHDFWHEFLTFCSYCRGASPGLQIEIAATVLVAVAYVLWASKSVWRAAACGVFVYAFVLFGAFFPGYLMTGLGHQFQDVYLYREIVSSYALFLTLAFAAALRAQDFWPLVRQRLRIERSFHYVGLALFGAFLGFPKWEHPFPGVLLPLAALAASVFFAFEAAVWVNDVFDRRVDQKADPERHKLVQALKPREQLFIAAFMGLSVLNGLAAGYGALVWIAFAVALSTVYSAPPLRLRVHFVLSSIILAACATAVFLAGYGLGLLQPEKAVGELPLSYAAMVFGLVFLASPFKDIKDAKGDAAEGLFTLPAWLGVRNARIITAVLVAASGIWVAWVSQMPLVLGVLFAAPAAYVVLAERNVGVLERNIFLLEYGLLACTALWLNGVRFGLG